jgi:hypothetical protein
MKRRDLLSHLEKHGCEFLREGGNHTGFRDIARSSIFLHGKSAKTSTFRSHEERDAP